MPRSIDPEVLRGFVEEARGYLPRIREAVDRVEADTSDLEALEEIHRLCHSIKGAASMVGLSSLGHMAFFLEEISEEIGAAQVEVDRDLLQAIRVSLDEIEGYLSDTSKGTLEERARLSVVVRAFRRYRGADEAGDEEAIATLLPEPSGSILGAEPETEEQVEISDPFPRFGPSHPGPEPESLGQDTEDGPETEDQQVSPELLGTFLEEAADHLATIGTELRGLSEAGASGDLHSVRRSVHTLKGAAGIIGLHRVGNLAHRMEDLLDAVVEGRREAEPAVIELLLATTDLFDEMVEAGDPRIFRAGRLAPVYERYAEILGGRGEPAADLAPLEAPPEIDLEEAIAGFVELSTEDAAPEASRAETPSEPSRSGSSQVVRVPIEKLDMLVRLVSELVVSRTAFEEHFLELRGQLTELERAGDRVRSIAGRLEGEYEVLALAGAAGGSFPAVAVGGSAAPLHLVPAGEGPGDETFDELELDRYTEFHLLSRGLSETASDFGSLRSQLSGTVSDFEGYLNRSRRLTSEVQDRLMRLRMVPLAQLASRLHRIVRVTARKSEKRASLVIEGQATELDKTVLEAIADPLLHLLRNAVDHGIEPPAVREARGKDPAGVVRLRARQEGPYIVLDVADDGGGIDFEALRQAAVSAGLVAAGEARRIGDEALRDLIFSPGLSTAPRLTEVSGRGIGLDVVRSSVARLKGTVEVDAEPGAGTRFRIRLPLTLALTRVLLVQAGTETFALPLSAVRQIFRLRSEELETVGDNVVLHRNRETYPLVELGEATGAASAATSEEGAPTLVLDVGSHRFALCVDRIVEAREVVVKTLGPLLVRAPGVSGATLLGDGRVVLILDPVALSPETGAPSISLGASAAPTPREEARTLRVMVAEDSVSVRKVVAHLLESAGWEAITAHDGLEALELLQGLAQPPDVLLLDIEMPKMDGFELLSALRGQPTWRHLPVVMLTSRAGSKHRQRAFELGADEYLVKPYQDETLLAVIRRLARQARDRDEGR